MKELHNHRLKQANQIDTSKQRKKKKGDRKAKLVV